MENYLFDSQMNRLPFNSNFIVCLKIHLAWSYERLCEGEGVNDQFVFILGYQLNVFCCFYPCIL